MKKMFVVLAVLTVCSIGQANVNDVNALTLEQCKARILELERIVQSQQDRIEKLILALNGDKQPETKIVDKNTKSTGEFNLSDGIIYHGKKRSPIWFNYWYNEFKGKIVYYNGQYVEMHPAKYTCTVLQVINDDEAMVSMSGYGVNSNRCHLKGHNKILIDDQTFSLYGLLISNGRYQYTTTSGAKATIASYTVEKCELLTKERFADAINSGFELTKEVKIGDKTITQPIP